MIYFCSVTLGETVHAQALGFTSHTFNHVVAIDEQEAVELVTSHYESGKAAHGTPVKVDKVQPRPALNQNQKGYVHLLHRTESPQWLLDMEKAEA